MVDDWERDHGSVREARRGVREVGDKRVCMKAIQAVRAEILVLFPRLTVFHLPSSAQTDRLLTSQASRTESKEVAPSNMKSMISPLEVFHLDKSDWNEEAL